MRLHVSAVRREFRLFVRIIFMIPNNLSGKQNTFPDHNLQSILKHIYTQGVLKLLYRNGGVFNCDYCNFRSDFLLQQVVTLWLILALVSISCSVIGLFTQFVFGCN
jgi:hypothetical protein